MSQGLAVFLALALVLALLVVPRLLGVKRMSSGTVVEKLRAGAVVLDVRRPDEVAQGAYPGAYHIPLADLPARLGELPRGRPVVVYCAAGMRAGSAAQVLRRAGFGDVTNAGGLADMPPA